MCEKSPQTDQTQKGNILAKGRKRGQRRAGCQAQHADTQHIGARPWPGRGAVLELADIVQGGKTAMETPARAEEEAAVSSAASVWRAEAHTDRITGC